jgi:SAM-dependent methyltransferase
MGFMAPYVPAEPEMLLQLEKLVSLRASDTFVDLGSGDGRVVRAAVERFGCSGVCVELDDELMALAREENAKLPDKVQQKIELLDGDALQVPWLERDPSVVFAYLSQPALQKLRPAFEQVCARRGVVVTCVFAVPGWGDRLRTSIPVASRRGEARRLFVYGTAKSHPGPQLPSQLRDVRPSCGALGHAGEPPLEPASCTAGAA